MKRITTAVQQGQLYEKVMYAFEKVQIV